MFSNSELGLSKRNITQDLITLTGLWQHPGFPVIISFPNNIGVKSRCTPQPTSLRVFLAVQILVSTIPGGRI